MNYLIKDFIGVFEDAFDKKYCEEVIQRFERIKSLGHTLTRQQTTEHSTIKQDDAQLFTNWINESNSEEYVCLGPYIQQFNDVFWKELYPKYAAKYSVLDGFAPFKSYHYKIQKTEIGGGYHIWHAETGNREHCHRLLTWILYLNDVNYGGETEFLYQHSRVQPKQGALILFPAEFTHTHRGNPPLSNEKYIATGWAEF